MQTNYSDLHPFIFMEGGDSYSLILEEVGDYKNEIFEEREEDGFLGNGYDWEALAQVYLRERMPDLTLSVHFDSEADTFCAYSDNKSDLYRFAKSFKETCENDSLIRDIFSRAELDME